MLLGYANEVGEAFRALVNVKFVYASYGLASAYVLADTNDKASKAKKLLGILLSNKFFKSFLYFSYICFILHIIRTIEIKIILNDN